MHGQFLCLVERSQIAISAAYVTDEKFSLLFGRYFFLFFYLFYAGILDTVLKHVTSLVT